MKPKFWRVSLGCSKLFLVVFEGVEGAWVTQRLRPWPSKGPLGGSVSSLGGLGGLRAGLGMRGTLREQFGKTFGIAKVSILQHQMMHFG